MTNIILCGGVGSRLWPLSRTHLPKQFARLLPGETLFESTVRRNKTLSESVLVASNRDQSFLAANQLRSMGIGQWRSVVEPVGRNTAPAIALACMVLDPSELVLVSPSDHIIKDEAAYRVAIERALIYANQGRLVTFGIKPQYAETGFGYIEVDSKDRSRVVSFKEKPDLKTAESYVKSGDFFWNSGMFCFKAGAFLDELRKHSPGVFESSRRAFELAPNKDPLEPRESDMLSIPSISIDYAVMEKSDRVACVACDIGWSDLGSFDALYDYLHDGQNALYSQSAPVVINSRNNLVINGERKVALIDVEDLLVVESPDALLISRKGSSQKVKEVVDALKKDKSSLTEVFPKVERPWGNYAVLHEELGYKVKRIQVEPGQRLSLQRHEHREEHWTVVKGQVVVQIERSRKHLTIGQGIMIPCHAIHRLENPGTETAVIIETQLGSYLGEDDIERLEDDYNR